MTDEYRRIVACYYVTTDFFRVTLRHLLKISTLKPSLCKIQKYYKGLDCVCVCVCVSVCARVLENRKETEVFNSASSGFGGLEVACWPLVPKFAGSHPAEAVGFLGPKKSSARLSSEGK
jgi:hypothetical protein